jgi:hydroxymethylpyrimidine/phosphomethylpyrimidine kinase
MTKKPYVLSIAGYDPSAGAGVLSDVKTFEAIGVYGLAIATCITYQNDSEFGGVHWLSKKKIKNQLYLLLPAYDIKYVKIGLIRNTALLSEIIELLISFKKDIQIVWDPVGKASAGFSFHRKLSEKNLHHIYNSIEFITPNYDEIEMLTQETDRKKGAAAIAKYCNVFLKGGHSEASPGTDHIWLKRKPYTLPPQSVSKFGKHGTGCVLSSALAAYLALGKTPLKACRLAKDYTLDFINSNESNLGYHISHKK